MYTHTHHKPKIEHSKTRQIEIQKLRFDNDFQKFFKNKKGLLEGANILCMIKE